MERQIETIRTILDAIAAAPADGAGQGKINLELLRDQLIQKQGIDPDCYMYHLKLLEDAGFFIDDNAAAGLSWDGCDYLDELRNEDTQNIV